MTSPLGANGAIGGALDQAIATDAEVEIALDQRHHDADGRVQRAGQGKRRRVVPHGTDLSWASPRAMRPMTRLRRWVQRNGTDWAAYTGPIELADEGVNTLYARATDGAGNTTQLPAEGARVPARLGRTDAGSHRASVAAAATTVEAADATSVWQTSSTGSCRMARGHRCRPGAAAAGAAAAAAAVTTEAFTATVPLDAEAATVEVRATDTAGNASAAVTLNFAADATVKPEPKPEPEAGREDPAR